MGSNPDSNALELRKKELRVAEHYVVEDFQLSDELAERYDEDPEGVMKEFLERHGHTVREVNIAGDPDQFTSGEIFCYSHVKYPPYAESMWEPYPCEAVPGGGISDRIDELYAKLRATIAIWTSFGSTPGEPRPPREREPPE